MKFLNEIPELKEKFERLRNVRATLSRIRGYGKASKEKVGPLLLLSEEMVEQNMMENAECILCGTCTDVCKFNVINYSFRKMT